MYKTANLYPYIYSEDARKQAEFYAQALNGDIADIRTFADAANEYEHMQDKVMHLVLHAAGGKVMMPFERMFWGAMFGRVEDPFGVRWQISTES